MPFAAQVRRVAVGVVPDDEREVGYFTFRPQADGSMDEDRPVRDVHPMVGRRLNLWRLRDFELTRLEAPEDVLLLHAVAAGNPQDQRLVALAQVRQLVVVRDEAGKVTALPHIERALANCLEAIRRARATLGAGARLDTNHVWLHIWPPVEADLDQLTALQGKVAPMTAGAGIEEVRIEGAIAGDNGHTLPICARFSYQPGSGVTFTVDQPATTRVAPLDGYAEKVVRARRRGLVYPYELVAMVAGTGGSVEELDLDESGRLVPVNRPYGENTAGLICGLVTTPTPLHPEGVSRVLLCGDPLRALGAVAEPECARVIAALDLAEERGLPVEWFALSAGARISMDSGTENMDWVAKALKRIIEFTQAGHEINVVVAGINVGAQPYWNAEATMLMHTKGILVMTPDSAMVLTGKQSLDFSGGVSAEDNFGIGGYDRVMGPNGQAQYWAKDLVDAYGILLAHYENTWVAPGEAGPRRAPTSDPHDRDVTPYPHELAGSDFTTVGDIFSPATNPDRKKAFDIRTLMRAVADQDHGILERWAGMADAETAVVLDARIGGIPVCLLGIESKSVPRRGVPPTDGPDVYTAGTLFPRSSKKAARAINAASGNRPLVVLANLSGFDGSPDSMRALQLEYGAEIGRAVVNFDGPIVFVVVSRYHGGAFVVFSKALNPRMTVLAVEGSFASVIGGAPAAAVVFARDVDARTAADPRVADLQARVGRGERCRAGRPRDRARVGAAGGAGRDAREGGVRVRPGARHPPCGRGRLGRRRHRAARGAPPDHRGDRGDRRLSAASRGAATSVETRLRTGTFTFAPLRKWCEREGSGIGRESWGQRTILRLNWAVPSAPISRSQIGSHISGPRAVSMPPRSMTSSCPNEVSSSVTVALAPASSPETNTVLLAPRDCGCTMRSAVRVLRVFTTLAEGNSRCTCSPSESVSLTNRVGGKPFEPSSGFEMSTSGLPARFSAPARPRTSSVAAPEVALTTSSAPAAASA